MKKYIVLSLLLALILVQVRVPVFAQDETEPNLAEKYDIVMESNSNLREEILKLKNELSENPANKIPVLLYHHILPQEYIDKYSWQDNESVLSLEAFKEQMDFLYENDFYTATLDELYAFLNGEIVLPERTVVITFDDGYLSNGLYAHPIMKEYNFRGTIFVHGHMADGDQVPFDPSNTQTISIHETYKYADVFDYESHTYDLHKNDENGEKMIISQEKNIVIEDLLKSKEMFDADYFAYPFGVYNDETIEYLKETGYKMGFTIQKEYVSKGSNIYTLPRFTITPNTSFSMYKIILYGYYGL